MSSRVMRCVPGVAGHRVLPWRCTSVACTLLSAKATTRMHTSKAIRYGTMDQTP